MTYNKRKINTKGEKAPSGYHYMQDDSLMSDEEHEKKYGKSFAKTLDCQDCKTIITDHGTTSSNELKFANPFTGDSTIITNPWFVGAYGYAYDELAKYDNFFWNQGTSQYNLPNIHPDIREFEIGPNCTVTYVRSISIPTNVIGKGAGMCAKNSNTLLAGSIKFSYTGPGNPYLGDHICEIDISGTTAVYTSLFQAPGTVAGDIVYIPSSNTIVASIAIKTQIFIMHFDMSGTILGQATLPVGVQGFGMFSYEDEVYVVNNQSGGYLYKFILQNHTLVPIITMTNFPGNDAASSPNCDNSPFDGDKYTWDCEVVAYGTKPPYAAINGCVQKTYPQVGAFLTQQDCINSNCGPPPPTTIQCSRCNNGSVVSNVFQGTTCPPGWQLTSLGDPCKPSTGPTPTDTITYG